MRDLRVVFGLDMETDIGSFTPFYEGLVNGTPRLLNMFAQKQIDITGYWVADAARKHPEIVKEMQSAGHEIGAHSLYHETVGDSLFDIPGLYPLLPEEVGNRIKIATDIVQDIIGCDVYSWRCPRLFGSTSVTNTLEELGYTSDATYPMYFFGERLLPYHPNKDDWTKEGNLNLIEIVQFADMGMDSKDEYGRDRDQWPIYRTESTEKLIPHIESYIHHVDLNDNTDRPVVLCFYFHPWEFWKMPEGQIHYGECSVIPDPFLIKGCGDYCLEQVGILLDWLKSKGAVFQTAKACAEEWQGLLKK